MLPIEENDVKGGDIYLDQLNEIFHLLPRQAQADILSKLYLTLLFGDLKYFNKPGNLNIPFKKRFDSYDEYSDIPPEENYYSKRNVEKYGISDIEYLRDTVHDLTVVHWWTTDKGYEPYY